MTEISFAYYFASGAFDEDIAINLAPCAIKQDIALQRQSLTIGNA